MKFIFITIKIIIILLLFIILKRKSENTCLLVCSVSLRG